MGKGEQSDHIIGGYPDRDLGEGPTRGIRFSHDPGVRGEELTKLCDELRQAASTAEEWGPEGEQEAER